LHDPAGHWLRRHHLPAHTTPLSLFGRDHGLAYKKGAGVAYLERAGSQVLFDALNEPIHKYGLPEIMNTDRGSHFTSFAWTDRLRRSGVRISPLGRSPRDDLPGKGSSSTITNAHILHLAANHLP
jgi:hypothetical protein